MPATRDTLDRLIEAASGSVAPERTGLFEHFAARLLLGVDDHHIGGEPVLAAMAAEAFDWIKRLEPGEIRTRVRNPDDRPGHTVVEMVQSDRPFIVDTLWLELRRRGAEARIVIHPLLPVERDATGRLTSIHEGTNGVALESYVYAEIVPPLPDDAACRDLEASLREVMGWVADMVADHRRMILAIRELMANLGVSASYTFRHFSNFNWRPIEGLRADDYVQRGTYTGSVQPVGQFSVPYYGVSTVPANRTRPHPHASHLPNPKKPRFLFPHASVRIPAAPWGGTKLPASSSRPSPSGDFA